MSDELHAVYRHLKDLSGSSNAIRDLLRDICKRGEKQASDINVSGTKEEMIRNLRQAVNLRYAELYEVQKTLWDLEEVGKQHVLLLRPAPEGLGTSKVQISDGMDVAVSLFDDTPIEHLFPRYEYPSSGFLWCDFRLQANGWLGKAYGRETYRQSQGIIATEELDDGTVQEIRQYKWKEVRSTLVANWRADSEILELRIDISNLQNEKTVDERRKELWTLLTPAFEPSDMIGVDIDGLLQKIIFERDVPENRERYSISRVELTDPRSGLIRVIPKANDSLDNDPGRKASLETMQKNGFLPSLVRIEWKPGLPGCPSCMTEPLSVVLEKTSNGPELRILKRITNATYEYIFGQLRSRLS